MASDKPSRNDLKLDTQALRQDWPIPPAVKIKLLQRAINVCDRESKEGRHAETRDVIAALKVLATFGAVTLKQQALDLAREKFERDAANDDVPTIRDVVADMQAAAERYEREHGSDRDGAPGLQDGPGAIQRNDPGEG